MWAAGQRPIGRRELLSLSGGGSLMSAAGTRTTDPTDPSAPSPPPVPPTPPSIHPYSRGRGFVPRSETSTKKKKNRLRLKIVRPSAPKLPGDGGATDQSGTPGMWRRWRVSLA